MGCEKWKGAGGGGMELEGGGGVNGVRGSFACDANGDPL